MRLYVRVMNSTNTSNSPQAMPVMDNCTRGTSGCASCLSAELKQNHRVYSFLLYATAPSNELCDHHHRDRLKPFYLSLKTSCVAGLAQETAFAMAI